MSIATTMAETWEQQHALPRTMRAAVMHGTERVEWVEAPLPVVENDRVIVKLEGCGVCASNIPIWEGRDWFQYPLEPGLPGHEGWGTVAAVGPEVTHLKIGDRVALFSLHAYAEYDAAAEDEVVRLPAALNGHPFPGEPLACAMNIFKRCEIASGQTVAIVGIGFMGGLVCQLAARAGARVIAISRRPAALERARACGATELLALGDHAQVMQAVQALTGGEGCDRVIEAVGLQGPLTLAGDLTKTRGRLIIAGYHQDGLREVNMQAWNWKGIDVINAHERDPRVYREGMRQAAESVAAGQLAPEPFFTHRFPLEQLADALAATRDRPGIFMKALIEYA